MGASKYLSQLALDFAPILIRIASSLLFLRAGFFAVSDDDFARLLIAQNQAVTFQFDPSGSSWLPFPFYIFGWGSPSFDGLNQTRLLALGLSAFSVWLVFHSAQLLGLSRWQSRASALLFALLPLGVQLGSSCLPEAWVGSFCLYGVVRLHADKSRNQLAQLSAILILVVASLSRYEAWAIIAGFLLFSALRYFRKEFDFGRLALHMLSLLGIASWLIHGYFRHQDPLFFVTRISRYRQILLSGESTIDALMLYPAALWENEKYSLICLVSIVLLLYFQNRQSASMMQINASITIGDAQESLPSASESGIGAATLLHRVDDAPSESTRSETSTAATKSRAWPALCFSAAALLLSLLQGALSGGAPTHHPERALLFLFILGCLGVGALLRILGAVSPITAPVTTAIKESRSKALREPRNRLLIASLIAVLGLASFPFVEALNAVESRDSGRRELYEFAKRIRPVCEGQTVLLSAADFSYVAIQAGLGPSVRTVALNPNDPRNDAALSWLKDLASVEQEAVKQRTQLWIAERSQSPFAADFGQLIDSIEAFGLFKAPRTDLHSAAQP